MRLSRAIIRRYYYQKAGVVQLNQNQSKILLSTRALFFEILLEL
jgi:hypothetical protein